MTLNELLAKLSQLQMNHGEATVFIEGWDTDGDWNPMMLERVVFEDGRIYVRSGL